MQVIITHLKAPWPAGAVVGSVVEVGEQLPGCFVGKCTPAPEDVQAEFTFVPAPPPAVVAETRIAGPADDVDAEELASVKALLAASEQAVAELTARCEAAEAKVAELGDALAKATEKPAKASK